MVEGPELQVKSSKDVSISPPGTDFEVSHDTIHRRRRGPTLHTTFKQQEPQEDCTHIRHNEPRRSRTTFSKGQQEHWIH